MAHDRKKAICEIVCREAIQNVSERMMQYSYAKMLLDKQCQLDSAERDDYIRCIAEMLGV